MVSRSTRLFGLHAIKSKGLKLKFIDEHIDRPDWIILAHVVVEPFGEQNALVSALTLDESLHDCVHTECVDVFYTGATAFSHSLGTKHSFAVLRVSGHLRTYKGVACVLDSGR